MKEEVEEIYAEGVFEKYIGNEIVSLFGYKGNWKEAPDKHTSESLRFHVLEERRTLNTAWDAEVKEPNPSVKQVDINNSSFSFK